jgi:hypothetical protein
MSDSDLPDDAGTPQTPALAEAFTKLRTATELLKKLNEETQASAADSGGDVAVRPLEGR